MRPHFIKSLLSLSLLCSAGNTATLQGKTVDYPAKDLGVFDMHTGNPVIPAYLADATMIYDQETDTFYAYGTND